jgi:hypothetical protein
MISIFLSYARGDDEPFVRRLYVDLTAHNFDVWFDRMSMPSRQLTFLQEIRDAIAARDRLLWWSGRASEPQIASCRSFFDCYNAQHHHSGIALHTPYAVHYGLAQEPNDARWNTLLAAYSAHPERFVKKPPEPPSLPDAVWINPPKLPGGSRDSDPALH